MTAIRVVLLLAGLALGAYGAVLLLDFPPVILLRIAIWAAAGVILHDFVFAPVCAAVGATSRHILPPRVRGPIGVAALCLVIIGLLAIPVFDKRGMRPDNLTVLNRDYHVGVLLAAAVVLVALLWYLIAARLLPVRQNEGVQQQGADRVDGQPPTM